MRPHIRKLVEILAEGVPLEAPIYEFGSYLVEGQEELANMRHFFPCMDYVGLDMREGPGVDVVLDMAPTYSEKRPSWKLPHPRLSTVLMLDTIEHVEYCREAVMNVHYNMGSPSIMIMTGAFYFKVHDYPSDYWRFTPAAFDSLLRPFDDRISIQCGNPKFPHTIVGIGLNGESYVSKADHIRGLLQSWQQTYAQ